mgnify:CR=1 FL=1
MLETVVWAMDAERGRISLGIKQREEDPFLAYVAENDKGAVVNGTVSSVDAKGAIVILSEGVEATLKVSEISRERVEDATTALKEGDKVEAAIINVDRKARTIAISIKQKDATEEKAAIKSHSEKQQAEATGPTTIGDLIKAQLENQN